MYVAVVEILYFLYTFRVIWLGYCSQPLVTLLSGLWKCIFGHHRRPQIFCRLQVSLLFGSPLPSLSPSTPLAPSLLPLSLPPSHGYTDTKHTHTHTQRQTHFLFSFLSIYFKFEVCFYFCAFACRPNFFGFFISISTSRAI